MVTNFTVYHGYWSHTVTTEAEASELGLSHTGPEVTGKPSANHQSERKSMSLQTGCKVFAGIELCRKDSAALKTFLFALVISRLPRFLAFCIKISTCLQTAKH